MTPESEIVQTDDGKYQIGFADDAAGPFETRQFAEAVVAAHRLARCAWLRKNSRHLTTEGAA
ncbi:hypothetical protein XH87_12160 [Bradyrhizobium sp. CCBAU 53415]|nr:hypothetical protein [Bradyrhizobium sp. CCBAU 53415]